MVWACVTCQEEGSEPPCCECGLETHCCCYCPAFSVEGREVEQLKLLDPDERVWCHTCLESLRVGAIHDCSGGERMTERKRETWKLIDAVVQNASRILLYGPPGTGKTTAGVAAGSPDTIYKVTLTEETPATDLLGHFVPMGDHFEWMDGRAIRAWREGARLVIDEIDRGSGDCLTLLYAILDDPDVARLSLPTGKDVVPQPGFSVVATMNGEPSDLPEALRDRFEVAIEVNEANPAAIAALPDDLQEAAKNSTGVEDPERAVSVRSWKSFAKLRKRIGDEHAAQAVFGRRAEEVLDSLSLAKVE